MKTAGLPYDYSRVRRPKDIRAKAVYWRVFRAAVAWRVMFRYFRGNSKAYVKYSHELKTMGNGKTSANQMAADNMADQILMLGDFEDDRIRRITGKGER